MASAPTGAMGASMGTRMGTAAGSAAIKNPAFAEAFTKAIFQQVAGSPEEANMQNQQQHNQILPTHHVAPQDNSIACNQEQLVEMKEWSKKIRFWYIGVSTLMVITSLLSFVSISVITSGFIAFYLLIFSCLICCFELGFKIFTRFIVQNFGFLYNTPGRLLFLLFVAVLSFSLGNKLLHLTINNLSQAYPYLIRCNGKALLCATSMLLCL